jgi:hypothetical protein
LNIDKRLEGQRLRNVARPEWGAGLVVSVQPAVGGQGARVTLDFPVVGRKTLLVPPARLAEAGSETRRQSGWLDELAGVSADQRLRLLPADVLLTLGTLRQRMDAILPWYAYESTAGSLAVWARKLVGVGDPLSEWSRDELELAFQVFSRERDAHLRAIAAMLKKQEGPAALQEWLEGVDSALKPRVREALARPV